KHSIPYEEHDPIHIEGLKGMSVLVVDDNKTNCQILEKKLLAWKMKPTLTHSGEEALEVLNNAIKKGNTFDLILIDAVMSDMDGFSLSRIIKEKHEFNEPVIIMMISSVLPSEAAWRQELGIASYLLKPVVTKSELLHAIFTALGFVSPDDIKTVASDFNQITDRRYRILLAEDNEINQKVAVRILKKSGHNVVVVNNGKEALEKLESDVFDIVLMDIQMPEMDGFSTTFAIRSKEQKTGGHIPIIAMTAHALKGDRDMCLKAGMDGYITKPVKRDKLNEVIRTLLSDSADSPEMKVNGESPGSTMSKPATPDLKTFNKAEALALMDGEEDLLREIVDLFFENCPNWLEDLEKSVQQSDAFHLEITAHKLKGSLRNIAAERAAMIAQDIEKIGKSQDLTRAREIYSILVEEITSLYTVLESFRHRNQT
ncbi:MAG TPA: response regulator, partial [Anaerolineae bacterium]|nr:response regulator [Anaerolineae bacterium]